MDSKLQKAFRWQLQNLFRAYGDTRRPAEIAIAKARDDVAAGRDRYPRPVRQMYRAAESDGLRYVGRVIPETNRRQIWDSGESCGWHTDPSGDVFKDGSGLCFGVVYQLPGRNGESRFIAGYEFGGVDGGPTLDLKRVFTEGRGDYSASPCELDAARDAARAADGLARAAAETEREYQTAWRAGSDYAQEAETIRDTRAELLELLAERRKAIRGAAMDSGYAQEVPAICKMIRRQVTQGLAVISAARETMRELAAGDYQDLIFWPGEARLQGAFCEGAGLDSFPGKGA